MYHSLSLLLYLLPCSPYQCRQLMFRYSINSNGKKDIDIAKEGLESMRKWMESIGCVMRINELGVNKDMIEDIASHTTILKGGYQEINKEDIIKILLDSF